MTPLSWIWLFFTLVFLGLSGFHFKSARKKVEEFQVTERPGRGSGTVKYLGLDIDQLINDFAADFNNYLKDYNKSTSLQNVFAGVGYLAAAVVALIAVLIELKVL